MKIVKLELKNFKRFTDLTIDLTSLTVAPKLVLLIGTNGSGKSSVFDGFEKLNDASKYDEHKQPKQLTLIKEVKVEHYYTKDEKSDYSIKADLLLKNVINAFQVEVHSSGYNQNIPPNSFYGRTSIRQVSKLTRTVTGQSNVSFENDSDRPRTFIDRDNRFENDLEKIALLIFSDFFKLNSSATELRENYINPINKAFENIFLPENSTQITLISIIPPLEGKTAEILFEKGTSQIPYDYLSSGEKEIFNILLNLLTRKAYFTDTIYFLDEIDLHLNTQLQKNLLKEITENWIPDNCQLWTASHSLGFIEYANEAEHAAIIDFDNLNFDLPQVITPSPKSNFDVFEIAVSKEFLAKVFEGRRIIFAENTDTALYNNLKIAGLVFFNAKDQADVFYKLKNDPSYHGLIDRDYLSDEERADLLTRYINLFILEYYSIENYLYHPDNLQEYFTSVDRDFDKDQYTNAILNERAKIKDKIIIGVARARDSYPFYRENDEETAMLLQAYRWNAEFILDFYDSPDFETFYKVFPAKDYGRNIHERRNLNKIELAKTAWFKSRIESVLIK